ncbi:MAG: MCE family protein [Bdellovibrionales bacterium]|nr:MCE family protein [Bdellovibrionales bacterium]
MNPSQATSSQKFKVGIFTIIGVILTLGVSVYVNDRPFWWRPCDLVYINVEDATGLKTKSQVRSLGIQVGYLKSVELFETYVRLGICITAPVEVLSSTRAYLRGEGFLGDKFVELKPVKYFGDALAPATKDQKEQKSSEPSSGASSGAKEIKSQKSVPTSFRAISRHPIAFWFSVLTFSDSHAQGRSKGKNIPVAGQGNQDVQELVGQVDGLVSEMKELTGNLKTAIDPVELKRTMQQLNKTLENASKTLAPGGGLNSTAQRTLEKLEDGIEQLRDIMTRINKGEGSVGMLINDPVYAQDIREVIKQLNLLLNRLGQVRINLDLFAEQIGQIGGRGSLFLNVWPNSTRYYRLGFTSDPRGSLRVINYSTTSGGTTTNVQTSAADLGGLVMNLQLGKVFWRRLDLAIGLLHGDGAISIETHLGPNEKETMLRLHGDLYARGRGVAINKRVWARFQPLVGTGVILSGVYLQGGIESFINNPTPQLPFAVAAGLTFDDEDIRILFAFR